MRSLPQNAPVPPSMTVVTLAPDDVFTVAEYPYTRFMFGTPRAYRARYNDPPGEPGVPYAFPLPAVLTARPVAREPIAAELAFGARITTPGYGTYRLARDHNRNVKLVEETNS